LNHHFLLVQSTLCLRNQNSYPSRREKPKDGNEVGAPTVDSHEDDTQGDNQ